MKKAFSIYDSKAAAYMIPFFEANHAVAIRAFTDAAMKEGHAFAIHAADYTLFEIGTFDEGTAELTKLGANINHGTALEHQSKAAAASNIMAAREEERHKLQVDFENEPTPIAKTIQPATRYETIETNN